MIDLNKMREKLLLKQLKLAEEMVAEPDQKKKKSLSFECMRCFFRIEFIDEMAQLLGENINVSRTDVN